MAQDNLDRRAFLEALGTGTAQLAVTLGAGFASARRLAAAPSVAAAARPEPWGRLERLDEGIWALISTPLAGGPAASRTVSNGGIIAGNEEVMVIEGLATDEGARWLSESARRLTGRWPAHVVLTHFHSDHSNGLPGHEWEGRTPVLYSTAKTREDAVARHAESGRPSSSAVAALQDADTQLIEEGLSRTIDLGGRRIDIVPRSGHTRSDLVVVVEDPRLVWCGDLVWNGLFPNYMDAIPTELSRHVRALLEEPAGLWVPGHGTLADRSELETYVALIEDVEAAARRAIEAGTPMKVAAAEYQLPDELGEWVLFSPDYYEVSFNAWARELTPEMGA